MPCMETREAIFTAVRRPSHGGAVVEKNDVAGLLTADDVATAKHFFEDVLVGAKHREIPGLRNAGLHFSAAIGKPSRRWTLSPLPTITFRVLYRFFVIGHDRGLILHFNLTPPPTSLIGSRMARRFPPRFDP